MKEYDFRFIMVGLIVDFIIWMYVALVICREVL